VSKNADKNGKAKREPDEAAKAAPDWVKKSVSKKKIRAKNVGGPIPPEYAKNMQRGWLDHNDGLIPQGSKQFIPQAGDLVLYYPRGHKLFIETHSDHLGNKTKQILRVPLWERAKKEKQGPAKKKVKSGKTDETGPADDEPKSPSKSAKHAPEKFPEDDNAKQSARKDKDESVLPKGDSKQPVDCDEVDEGAKKEAKATPKKKESSPSPQWWNEQWLAAMEGDVGACFPVLCRVETTQAEFPYNRGAVDIATNRKTSWSLAIDKEKKKQIKQQLTKKKPLLRLSVTLKPLTSLIPPTWKGSAKHRLVPPPLFTAVCFPSRHVSPFILPFFWTYRLSHSLSIGDRVKMQYDDDIYTGQLVNLADETGTLEKAFTLFPEIFHDDNKMPLDQRLEQLLVVASSLKSATLPFEDVRAVLQYVSYYWHNTHGKGQSMSACVDASKNSLSSTRAAVATEGEDAMLGEPLNRGLSYTTLVDFICATLPRWDNAVVRWDDESTTDVSPWELVLADAKEPSAVYPGCRPGDLIYNLGGKLLEDIQLSIQGYIDEKPEAANFVAPVDVKSTPSYLGCVPLPMSIQRILGRLEQRPLKKEATMMSGEETSNHKLCYYRGVAAIVADLNDIAHNCVLYNDSDSELTKSVRNVVEDLKWIVESVETTLQRKKDKKKGKNEESPGQMLLWQSQFMELSKRERDPFVAPMRRMWAQEVVPDRSWGGSIAPRLRSAALVPVSGVGNPESGPTDRDGTTTSTNEPAENQAMVIDEPSPVNDIREGFDLNSWVPQVGDEVFYSRNENSTYLRGHFTSLSDKQRTLPSVLPSWMEQPPQQNLQHQQSHYPQENGPSSSTVVANSNSAGAGVFQGWLVGTIASIRATFPPPPPEDDSARTFDDLTPVLEIAINFNYPWLRQKLHLVHWRPCQVRGTDPVLKPPRKKKKKPTFRPIRVKALVKKKDVNPGKQLYFKPQAMKKNSRLARALGIKKQAVRINIKVNNKVVGPPTKRAKVLFFERKHFENDEDLSEALFGEDATKPSQIVAKLDGKKILPNPISLPAGVVDKVEGLSDALDNAGIGQFKSMSVFVKVNDQNILRKPVMLPPYVMEEIAGLADAIGSKRRENEPNPEGRDGNKARESRATQEEARQLIGETESGKCMCCGLDSETSFLRPAWINPSSYNVVNPVPPVPRCAAPPGLPAELTQNIVRLLEIMKERAISGISPDSLKDEIFDEENSGFEGQQGSAIVTTQSYASNMPAQDKETLAKLHFLPPWFADDANDEVRDGIRKSDAFLPLPYLCLDLVHRRLKQGFYRSLMGATHDIREAYVVTVMYLLSTEGIESLKKMAVLLSQRIQPTSNGVADTAAVPAGGQGPKMKKRKKSKDGSTDTMVHGVRVTLKEASLLKRIERVRKLYAAALTCFTHTIVVETALGRKRDTPTIERLSPAEFIANKRQLATRRKISLLLDLINPDPCRFRRRTRGFQPNPTVRIKVALDNGGNNESTESVQIAAGSNDPLHPEGVPNGQNPSAVKAHAIGLNDGRKEQDAVSKERTSPDQGSRNGSQSKALMDVEKALALCNAQESEANQDGTDEDPEEDSRIDLSQPLLLEPQDYISSAVLTRALFGREGRQDACVRCKKASRSMFACRVLRGHSTTDFDLDEVLGERGIDGLIEELLSKPEPRPAGSTLESPTQSAEEESSPPCIENSAEGAQDPREKGASSDGCPNVNKATDRPDEDKDDAESLKNSGDAVAKGDPKEDDTHGDAELDGNVAIESESREDKGEDEAAATAAATATAVDKPGEQPQLQENISGDAQTPSKSDGHALSEAERTAMALVAQDKEKEKRALESFAKAQLAQKLARETLVAANAAMDKPPALSQEFVKLYYPIDAIDGHYEICVVCGLGGDILCCETCANVAHTKCAGLKEVPEGDWFCKLCVARGKGPKIGEHSGSAEKTPDVAKDDTSGAVDVSADAATAEAEKTSEANGSADQESITAPSNRDDTAVASPVIESIPGEKSHTHAGDNDGTEDDTEKKTPEDKSMVDSSVATEQSQAELREQNDDDTGKKVKFEQHLEVDSSSHAAAVAAVDAAIVTTEATTDQEPQEKADETFEDKVAKLEGILNELKSSRQKKPKKQQEEKKIEEGKPSHDDGGVAEESDEAKDAAEQEEDYDDGAARSTRTRRPTKGTKTPKRERMLIELGTKILKDFEGHGDFEGTIEAVPASDDEGDEFYRVRYIDGDEEDMSEDEAHACVEYWKEKNKNAEPEDPNVRKRRKPKRFETVQAAAELKSRKKQSDRGSLQPSRSSSGRRSAAGAGNAADRYMECKVEGCTKYKQGGCGGMCQSHYNARQGGGDLESGATRRKGRSRQSSASASNRSRRRKRKTDSDSESSASSSAAAEEESPYSSSPARKRSRRGSPVRRTDYNLAGGPHKRPRGRMPSGKVWDSHNGLWIDE